MLSCVNLGMALPALHLDPGASLPVPGDLQLGDEPRLFVLVKGTRDLAHHDARRVAAVCEVIAICCQDAHAAID
jgi:hypothetical protein